MIAALLVILACIWFVWTLTVFIRVVMNLARALWHLAHLLAMVAALLVLGALTGARWACRPKARAAGNVVRLSDYRRSRTS